MSAHKKIKKRQSEAELAPADPAPADPAPAATAAAGAVKAVALPAGAPREILKRPKLVRDSFALPDTEYAALAIVKKACQEAGLPVKKSALLRAGVAHLGAMDTAGLKQALDALPRLRSGRPKKGKSARLPPAPAAAGSHFATGTTGVRPVGCPCRIAPNRHGCAAARRWPPAPPLPRH